MGRPEISQAVWLHYRQTVPCRRRAAAELWRGRNGLVGSTEDVGPAVANSHERARLYCSAVWFLLIAEDCCLTASLKITPILSPTWKCHFNDKFNKLCPEHDQHKTTDLTFPLWALQKALTGVAEAGSVLLLCCQHRAAEQTWNTFLWSALAQLERPGTANQPSQWWPCTLEESSQPPGPWGQGLGRRLPLSPRWTAAQSAPSRVTWRSLSRACSAQSRPRAAFLQCTHFISPPLEACSAVCCGTVTCF